MKFTAALLMLPLLLGQAIAAPSSSGDPEVLLKAINFALEGKDDTGFYVWKSRPDCVVIADHSMTNFHGVEVIYLNHVDVSRIRLTPWSTNPAGVTERYVDVELHGEDTIRKYTAEYAGSSPVNESMNAYKFTVETAEFDRMMRAWKYIYTHGCKGAKSSF